ncbi:MAG: hypothetical protein P0116_12815 [Candidatus Nitrosocosmicus sp.]|nr:hypothetical protein [Candidatus Nitrosocosmicus sp.]
MTITKTQQIELTRKIFKILGGEKNVYNLHFYWNKGDGLEFYMVVYQRFKRNKSKNCLIEIDSYILVENSKPNPLESYHLTMVYTFGYTKSPRIKPTNIMSLNIQAPHLLTSLYYRDSPSPFPPNTLLVLVTD